LRSTSKRASGAWIRTPYFSPLIRLAYRRNFQVPQFGRVCPENTMHMALIVAGQDF
jgi:hypothetical protein